MILHAAFFQLEIEFSHYQLLLVSLEVSHVGFRHLLKDVNVFQNLIAIAIDENSYQIIDFQLTLFLI